MKRHFRRNYLKVVLDNEFRTKIKSVFFNRYAIFAVFTIGIYLPLNSWLVLQDPVSFTTQKLLFYGFSSIEKKDKVFTAYN